MRKQIALLSTAVLVGCAANDVEQNRQPQTATVKNDTPIEVSRILSVEWEDMAGGGAALRQSGYIHVLGSHVRSTMNKIEDKVADTDKTRAGLKQHEEGREVINISSPINQGEGDG